MAGGEVPMPGAISPIELLGSLILADSSVTIGPSGFATGTDDVVGRLWQINAYVRQGNYDVDQLATIEAIAEKVGSSLDN